MSRLLRWPRHAGERLWIATRALYLNLGTGLAAAVVIGGRVVHGRHGASGEIAYNLRSLDDVDVPIESRSLLEDHVSGRALAELGSAACRAPPT